MTLLILFIVLLFILFIGGLLNANKGPECESDFDRASSEAEKKCAPSTSSSTVPNGKAGTVGEFPNLEARELTTDERMVWGECPVCRAGHGEWCCSEIGLHLGSKLNGDSMKTGEGVHLARINNAPTR